MVRVDGSAAPALARPRHVLRLGALEIYPEEFAVHLHAPGKRDAIEDFSDGLLQLVPQKESLRGAYPAFEGGLPDRHSVQLAVDEPEPCGGFAFDVFRRPFGARHRRGTAGRAFPSSVAARPPVASHRQSALRAGRPSLRLVGERIEPLRAPELEYRHHDGDLVIHEAIRQAFQFSIVHRQKETPLANPLPDLFAKTNPMERAGQRRLLSQGIGRVLGLFWHCHYTTAGSNRLNTHT